MALGRNYTSGSSQYLSNANAIGGTYPFTMACWFYGTSAAAAGYNLMAVTSGVASDNQIHRLGLVTSGGSPAAVQAISRTTSNASAATTANWSLNTLHHACGVFTAGNDRAVFLDGGNKGTNTTNRTPSGMSSTQIGRYASTPLYMDGDIFVPCIWDVALSDAEVAQLANGMWPGRIRPANIIGFWPCGFGSPEVDLSGQNRPMTLNNAPTISTIGPRLQLPFGYDVPWIPPSAGATAYTLTAASGSYAVTGTAASLEWGREVAAGSGSFAVSGTAASLEYGREVAAGSGAYTVSGTDATFRRTYSLSAGSGSFAVAGTGASLEWGRKITADSGSYTVSGTDAALNKGRRLVADSGSYAVSGTDATLRRAAVLTAAGGSHTITGAAASLEYGRTLAAGSGAYTVTGTGAALEFGRKLTVEFGSVTITGDAASLEYGRLLTAAAGAYAINGTDATLTYAPASVPGVAGYRYTVHGCDSDRYAVRGAGNARSSIRGASNERYVLVRD